MKFTAHPVRLPDDTLTMPDSTWDMSRHPLFVVARAVLFGYFKGDLVGKTLVDLGCLEGGYTVEFARLGMEATGIEVRSNNIAACNLVGDAVKLPNLRFVQDDCWNLPKYGRFDVGFCSGLLYHLAQPRQYLELLAAHVDVLVLDTHFATETGTAEHWIGEIATHEGMRGRWLNEYSAEANPRDEAANWSAWGNRRSFWPMKPDLLGAIRDAGFSRITPDLRTEKNHDRLAVAAMRD